MAKKEQQVREVIKNAVYEAEIEVRSAIAVAKQEANHRRRPKKVSLILCTALLSLTTKILMMRTLMKSGLILKLQL